MEFSSVSSSDKRKSADAIILPFWKGKKQAEKAFGETVFSTDYKGVVATKDFKGKQGEVLALYPSKAKEKRIFLLGLGSQEEVTVETLRRAYAAVVKACQKKEKLQSLNVFVPQMKSLDEQEVLRGMTEGFLLANYSFDQLKTSSNGSTTAPLKKAFYIGASTGAMKLVKKTKSLCEGVYLARDLVNGNADDVTPQYLSSLAKDLGKKFSKVKATVFDKKKIQKEKMGLLLAVSRGAARDPAFIILEYKGAPRSKDHTVMVGKGVTYDTGGLNLKPTGAMETMKCDMAGAAAAFGTLQAVAAMELKVNLSVVVAATENSIDSQSYKPGDVYASYLGKTVEIGNTDAEGRLTLADALAYATKKLKPTRVVDFATLTGAIVIALGEETIGMMSNDQDLAQAFSQAGQATYERVCQLPLYEEYKEQLKSDIADLNNIGGRAAGSITAGAFLQEFVGKTPWVHFDIAGTAHLSKARRYHPKNGTGAGVRLMVEYLESL